MPSVRRQRASFDANAQFSLNLVYKTLCVPVSCPRCNASRIRVRSEGSSPPRQLRGTYSAMIVPLHAGEPEGVSRAYQRRAKSNGAQTFLHPLV